MTKPQLTPPQGILVAIDIGKTRNEVLIEIPGHARRRRLTVLNTRAEYDRLIDLLSGLGQPVTCAFEATGNYHRPLAWRLLQAGFTVRLISSLALARTREALHNGWDKNDPKDAQVILHVLRIGASQRYHDPLGAGINDIQEVSKTHEAISKAKTEVLHRILTHHLPLYFPEIDRFRHNSRSDWFFAFLDRYPTPGSITVLSKEAFIAAAWDVVGRKVAKERLLGDIYETARASIGLPIPIDAPAVRLFRLVIAEARSLIQQRNALEAMAVELLHESPDYSGSGLHGIGCSDSRCRGLALREARHDGTVVAGFARADRARGWGGEFSSRRGGAVRGEPVGGDQADAAGAPDRQHGSGEDRRPAPADPGAACRYAADDRNEQARDHAQGDAGSPAGPRHRREGAVHHRRHAASAGAVAQKKSLRAAEQDRPDVARHRRRWRVWQRYMDADRFVFLDETGATTSMTRRYGWGERGERLVDAAPYGPWKTTTFVAGLRASGIIAPFVLDGPMNGEAFRVYVEQVLAPELESGDVVAMDNLQAHKVAGVEEAIRAAGASVLYLPSYSPDLNPIEQLFAKLKELLRKAAARTKQALWDAIGQHLDDFTPEECRNYLAHCGYEL